MSPQPKSNKAASGIGRGAKAALAVTLLAAGAWAFGPAAVRTGRWAVSKIVAPAEESPTSDTSDSAKGDAVEVAPAATWSLLDPPSYSADDWPGWRGTDADNCSPDSDCPTVWSEGENVKWRAEVPGRGYSSPVVVGNRIFVTTAVESSHRVLALAIDKNTGQEIWRRIIAEGNFRSIHEFNSHASSTPICDGRKLFVAVLIENSVHLTALSVRDGEVLWTTNCGPCTAKWGFSGSLAYWRGLVYLTVDNPEGGWIAAFTAQRGEVAWRQKRSPAQEGSYSSPIVAQIHGVPQVVVAGAGTITAYQPESGAVAWAYQGVPSCCVCTIVVADDLCVAAGGWPDRKLICIRVNQSADSEKMTPELLWESGKAGETPYVPTPLYHAGKLYVVHDQGIVMCRDAISGKIDWKRRLEGNFHASPVLIGGKLLVCNAEGVSSVLDPDSGEIVAQNLLKSGLRASPTPSDSCLFLKGDGELYCIGSARTN
jgi:outer membrane protein assembly factor BamB